MQALPVTKPLKIALCSCWAMVAAASVTLLFFLPDGFTAQSMAVFLQQAGKYFLVLYIAVSLLRGFTLLPSTPFVLAGSLLLPDSNWLVVVISLLGILLSTAIIYKLSHVLGFDLFFQKKFPRKIQYLQGKINKPEGLLLVTFWSFFPVFPTDLICYVAGTTKMHFGKFMLAVFLGELPIVMAYVWAGKSLFSLIFN